MYQQYSNSESASLPRGFVTPPKAKAQAQDLANSVRKKFRHLSKRFKRQGIDCFRLYDWDSPDIRVVVDWYAGHIVVAEYERIQTGSQYLPQMAAAAGLALNVPQDNIHIKRRHTNIKEGPRYKKMDSRGERLEVRERNLRFWVNLDDFLDTGLFSDHRDTRSLITKLAAGSDFLNLFAYTGAFTCAAALGAAKTTVTVDRSQTYIAWAKDNLVLNGLWGPQHALAQSDAMRYLAYAWRAGLRFTLAFVDPPSFFKDANQQIAFDVNHDHPALLRAVFQVMQPGSLVFFSTNHQRFVPRFDDIPAKDIVELTPKTIPQDYRNRSIHRCWQMKA